MQQDNIDILLATRGAPPSCGDLAERIIHAAMRLEPKKAGMTLWHEFMQMFALPHPSVALAAGVILGIVMGIQAGEGLTVLDQDWSAFLDINEGGWL